MRITIYDKKIFLDGHKSREERKLIDQTLPLVPDVGEPPKSLHMTNHFLKAEHDLGLIMIKEQH